MRQRNKSLLMASGSKKTKPLPTDIVLTKCEFTFLFLTIKCTLLLE